MTDKATFTRASATGNLQSLITNYNANLDVLEDALDDSLSLSGKLPNSLTAPLDANSQRILNLADAEDAGDAVTKRQLDEVINNSLSLDNVPSLTFDQASTDVGEVGRFVWNNTDGTLDLGLKGGNVTLQLGQETLARVVNKTGADFLEANYQVVRIDGAQGQRVKVALAQADSAVNASGTLGLVTETIANNQEGFVTLLGAIRNINTTGSLQGETWSDGDTLYLSQATAGRLTKTKPSSGIVCKVGYVEHAHATHGRIMVHVENFAGLQETLVSGTNIKTVNGNSLVGSGNVAIATGTTTNAITFNNAGSGAASGTTFDGSVARTISHNTIGAAPLASPTFTGTPAAPTAAVGTNTTQLATTAFVNAEIANDAVVLTGNQTVAGNKTFSGTTALAAGSTIDSIVIGYRDVPVTIGNGNRTFALADAGKAFGKDNATAYTYTIPANSSVAFPVGTVITVFNNNATSNITVAITTDTLRLAGTTTTGSRTVAPFSLCTLFKVNATTWLASGAGVT